VTDVAAAIALAGTRPDAAGRIYNVGEPDALTQLEWLQALATTLGRLDAVRIDPQVPPSLPARWTVPLVVSTQRIRQELGYVEPIGRSEGLRRTVSQAAA
jgi:nucleoside-diphosphate-sugar epimerase